MREILFRGKRKSDGKWIYGMYDSEKHSADFDCIIRRRDSEDYGSADWAVDPATVGQFTGLTDKNGAKIFEGDIVKTTALSNDHNQRGATFVSPVEYWNGATCLSITYCPLSLDFLLTHDIEIIGNIHDNPELRREHG